MPFSRLGPVTGLPLRRTSPVVGVLETADHPHDGGLAAAGRSDEDDELAFADGKVERIDHRHVAPVLLLEDLGQCPELDEISAVGHGSIRSDSGTSGDAAPG